MLNDYISRINKSLDYIALNLANSMTLEELASVACFSKYHFNRIFHSIVGETPFQFILHCRLEKAASLLLANKNEAISEIGFRCGFTDIAIFSRKFKNYFNISATLYRRQKTQNSNISQWNSNETQTEVESSMYFCPSLQTIKWRTSMTLNKSLEVKMLPKTTVAYIRNIGPYNGDQKLFGQLRDKLFAWAGARSLFGSDNFKFIVLYHDDPRVAISDKLRMSLCITIPPETQVEGEIGKMEIESTIYAVAKFELKGTEFQQAWDWLYGQWLPTSGYQADDKPYFEMYTDAPKDGNYIIDFCIPVKPV